MNTENENEQSEEQFVSDVQQETNGTEQREEKSQASPTALTQKDLEAAFEKLGTTFASASRPQEKAEQLSDADQKKLWAIYDPEEGQKDFMRKFFRLNPEATPQDEADARAMFKSMQEGLVRQSVVGARNLFQLELKKLREEFAPLQQFHRDAQAEKLQSEFFRSYPVLSELDEATSSPRYMTAIRLAATDLANQTFTSRPLYFKALADRTAEIVKGILPEFDLGAKTKTNKSSTSTPSLPRTRVGGSGGTARSEGSQDTKAQRGANGDDASTLEWLTQS